MVKTEQKILPERSTGASSLSSNGNEKKKKYKGVRMRSWGSWVSEIRAPNQKTRIWLGSYSTPEAAARAYDAALLCLKGSSANLNFPITSSHYIPDAVMSPKSIQRVAAAAAANSLIDISAAKETSASPSASVSSAATTPSISSCSSVPSSPSDQFEAYDDVSLAQPFDDNNLSFYNINNDQQPIMYDSWYSFDQMLINGDPAINMPSSTTPIDDFYEGDICLWSFTE